LGQDQRYHHDNGIIDENAHCQPGEGQQACRGGVLAALARPVGVQPPRHHRDSTEYVWDRGDESNLAD
jgi:hypothetical protein